MNKFSSRYDSNSRDPRYTDFIDLKACIRNISNEIVKSDMADDCLFCKYAESYGSMKCSSSETCKKCIVNPEYKYNYETDPLAMKPKSEWTEEETQKYSME